MLLVSTKFSDHTMSDSVSTVSNSRLLLKVTKWWFRIRCTKLFCCYAI